MHWTCQADGPLWWATHRADHWYCRDTPPNALVADYLTAHPHHRDRPLVLTLWRNWAAVEMRMRVEPVGAGQAESAI